MNMVMAGDGHANVFHINSLDYPHGSKIDELEKIKETIARSIHTSPDRNFPYESDDAREKFDLIFTNPPFGAKVEVDVEISKRYELGHNWSKDTYGNCIKGNASTSEAPEVLFIEQCYNFLKPGGRLVCLELSHPTWPVFRHGHQVFVRFAVPLIGNLSRRGERNYQWLSDSLRRFPGAAALADRMRLAGLQKLQVQRLSGGIAAIHKGIR